MSNKAVFIHSLFRTGSTYVWNKFRGLPGFYCYYEPFHQGLANIGPDNPYFRFYDRNSTDRIHHPELTKDYLAEYRELFLPTPGRVPHFKKSFSFDDFCNNDQNLDQKRYIDFLIAQTGDKIPLFQFNRSALRIAWFKENYPDCLHIYLVRSPGDQFHSYMDMLEKNKLDSFLTMDLITAGKNRSSPFFRALVDRVPLPRYDADNFGDEKTLYSMLLPAYDKNERYFIFYYTWFSALVENGLRADLILNIDLLSWDDAYREEIEAKLQKRHLPRIDFKDARVHRYDDPLFPGAGQEEIESRVRTLVVERFDEEQLREFAKRLGRFNRSFFHLDSQELLTLKQRGPADRGGSEQAQKKYDQWFDILSRQLVEKHNREQRQSLELKDLRDRFKDSQTQLETAQEQLRAARTNLEEARGQLQESQTQCQSLQARVGILEEEIENTRRELQLKDLPLKKIRRQLAEKQRALEFEQEQNRLKTEEIANKDRQIQEKDQTIAQSSALLAETRLRLDEQKKETAQLRRQLSEEERRVKEQNRRLEEQNRRLEEARQALERKDRVLEEKQTRLTQKNARIGELVKESAEKSEKIAAKNHRIQTLDKKLTGIRRNILFRILKKLKLIDREPK